MERAKNYRRLGYDKDEESERLYRGVAWLFIILLFYKHVSPKYLASGDCI